jgi:hypothetical protein
LQCSALLLRFLVRAKNVYLVAIKLQVIRPIREIIAVKEQRILMHLRNLFQPMLKDLEPQRNA